MPLRFDAIEYPRGSGIYVPMGAGTDYGGRFLAARASSLGTSIAADTESRAGGALLLRNVSFDGGSIPITFVRDRGGSLSAADFSRDMKRYVNPLRGRDGLRYLRVLGDDGVSTWRIAVQVLEARPRDGVPDVWDALCLAPVPWFESTTAQTATVVASPGVSVNNTGTTPAYPSFSLTPAVISGSRWQVSMVGGGVAIPNCPVVLPSSTYATTSVVLVDGVSVPFASIGGVIAVLVNVPGTNTVVYVDVIPTGITNALAGTLDLGQLSSIDSTPPFTNILWTWVGWTLSTAPERVGYWRPIGITFAGTQPSDWGYAMSEGTNGVTFTLSNPGGAAPNDANATLLDLGNHGATNTLPDLKRVTTNHTTGVRSFIRARARGQSAWTSVWEQTGNATVTTDVQLTTFAQAVIGIEYTATDGTDGAALALSGETTASTRTANVQNISISGPSARGYQVLDGSISGAGGTITFSNFVTEDGAVTVDCSAEPTLRRISVPSGWSAGTVTFGDDDWYAIDPGTSSIVKSAGLSAVTVAVTWRDATT